MKNGPLSLFCGRCSGVLSSSELWINPRTSSGISCLVGQASLILTPSPFFLLGRIGLERVCWWYLNLHVYKNINVKNLFCRFWLGPSPFIFFSLLQPQLKACFGSGQDPWDKQDWINPIIINFQSEIINKNNLQLEIGRQMLAGRDSTFGIMFNSLPTNMC